MTESSNGLVEWDLQVGDVLRRTEVHKRFGGSGQGGIASAPRSGSVLLFSSAQGAQYGYDYDGWHEDGSYRYTGEGQDGDQLLVRGNKAVLESGRALRLFEEAQRSHVRYIGEFTLDPDEPYYRADAPDKTGKLRSVIVFRLWPAGSVPPAPAASEPTGPEVQSSPVESADTSSGEVRSDHEQWAADAPATKDMLKRDALASVLAARLRRFSHHEPCHSFLLHVDGPWGSGKSTLLKLLKPHLDKHYLVVPFDSWQNSKVDPPWWALLVTLRQHVSWDLPRWRRPFFRIAEAWTRARRGSTPYLLTGLVLLLLLGGLVLLSPAWLSGNGLGQAVTSITKPLSALGSVALVILLVSRFVLWDSARGAKRLEQVHTNPMQEVTQHFSWLLARAPRRVVFFIDDLDRCGDRYVVELLDAVQTLVRDAPDKKRTAGRSAYFVVAAHGNWLRRAYEAVHQPFQGAVDEPGRGLGHLFLDKLFQLTVPMPTLGPDTKRQYFDHVLGIQSSDQVGADESDELREQIERSTSETELLDVLKSVSPEQREAAAARAVERMSEPRIAEVTEHALQKFTSLMDGNPRSMKRFVNTYSVLRAARTLEGITVDSDVLAFWTVLHIRWPLLTEYLEANLNAVASTGSTEVRLDSMPDEYGPLLEDPELLHVLATSPVRLTPDLVGACCGALADSLLDEAVADAIDQ
ncbi:P-loop NTPase fold protein [Saccharopolyspora sp. NPDC050642]|uniref:KAP family P-loop NTPase fold protein n=1 Tax=Saccharopolyspora sp. NPDC050642 TaxID=3157099 RepID=UPI0033F17323